MAQPAVRDSPADETNPTMAESATGAVVSWVPAEVDALQEMFVICAHECPDVFGAWEDATSAAEHPSLVSALLHFAKATGTVFDVIHGLVRREFVMNAGAQGGSIMRGNGIASRLTKEFLKMTGSVYLHSVLDETLLTCSRLNRALEVDPMKLDPPPTDLDDPSRDPAAVHLITQHKEELLVIARKLVDSLVRSLGQMPDEIKSVANIFAELAGRFAPNQFFSLVGGFLVLRYLNPALSAPESFGIKASAEGEALNFSLTTRRNLVLLAKILQNISNGQEFGKKEPYMMIFNEFVRANTWKIEKFFREVVAHAPNHPPEQLVADLLTDGNVTRVHYLLTHNSEKALMRASQAATLAKIKALLERLRSYRTVENFLEAVATRESNARSQSIIGCDTEVRVRLVVETSSQTYETSMTAHAAVAEGAIKDCLRTLQKLEKKVRSPIVAAPDRASIDIAGVFGKPLRSVMAAQKTRYPALKVPKFVSEILAEVIRRGLAESLLFYWPFVEQRKEFDFVSQLGTDGSRPRSSRKLFGKRDIPVGSIDALAEVADRGDIPRLAKLKADVDTLRMAVQYPSTSGPTPPWRTADISAMCQLLVSYLLELPEPVIPASIVKESGCEAIALQVLSGVVVLDEALTASRLTSVVRRLPEDNQQLLAAVMKVLAIIKSNYTTNGLHAARLASIFGPLLCGVARIPAPIKRKERKADIKSQSGLARLTRRKKGDWDEPDTFQQFDVVQHPFIPEVAATSTVSTLLIERMIEQFENTFRAITDEEEADLSIPLWRARVIAHSKGISSVRCVLDDVMLTWSHNELRLWHLPPGSSHLRRLTDIDNGLQNDLILDVHTVRIATRRSDSIYGARLAHDIEDYVLWICTPVCVRVWNLRIRGEFAGPDRLSSQEQRQRSLPVLKAAPVCIHTISTGCYSLTSYGSLMVGASCDEPQLVVWDMMTYIQCATVPMFSHVNCIAPVGERLWGGTGDGTICVWKIRQGIPEHAITLPGAGVIDGSHKIRHARKIRTIAMISNESGFAPVTVWTGSDDGIICVWNALSFELLHSFDSHAGKIGSLTYECGAVWCATWERSVRAYSVQAELLVDLKGEHEDGVTGVAFSYDRDRERWRFVSSSYDHTLCVWLVPKDPRVLASRTDTAERRIRSQTQSVKQMDPVVFDFHSAEALTQPPTPQQRSTLPNVAAPVSAPSVNSAELAAAPPAPAPLQAPAENQVQLQYPTQAFSKGDSVGTPGAQEYQNIGESDGGVDNTEIQPPQANVFSAFPFFHAHITGSDAEALVAEYGPGAYLLRYSSQPGLLAASYVLPDATVCSALVGVDDTAVWLVDFPDDVFSNLETLVESNNRILCRGVPPAV